MHDFSTIQYNVYCICTSPSTYKQNDYFSSVLTEQGWRRHFYLDGGVARLIQRKTCLSIGSKSRGSIPLRNFEN